ncbi:hypothetical protein SAMN02745132_01050 [Enterovibrio nigricans DSM 22720]|uniref:Uncharacterized protein n=1 Tax=Enterovibrio nigricans DSM 22720 TaxID=1121868 RepID=A0A1T4U911_9GAMM|nr:hypothetical protein SAMN02745132_01050 [Enterovibrio nigricans DSM 22720]
MAIRCPRMSLYGEYLYSTALGRSTRFFFLTITTPTCTENLMVQKIIVISNKAISYIRCILLQKDGEASLFIAGQHINNIINATTNEKALIKIKKAATWQPFLFLNRFLIYPVLRIPAAIPAMVTISASSRGVCSSADARVRWSSSACSMLRGST